MNTFDPENPFGLPELSRGEEGHLRAHIETYVRDNELKWHEECIGWLEAEGALGEKWFTSPLLRNEFAYLVALHEIGHHVLDLPTDDEKSQVVFADEVDVWQWALAESIILPSDGAMRQVRACLATYPEQRPPDDQVERLRRIASDTGHTQMRWRSETEHEA